MGLGPRASGLGLMAIVAIGCENAPELSSCRESISGVWRAADGKRWAVMDLGARPEIYPMFADGALPPGAAPDIVASPRVIDLERAGALVTGTIRRRFMRGKRSCTIEASIPAIACSGRTITIELPSELPAPTAFEPCAYPPIPPPIATTWTWESELQP
jgi:hypothetical protein